MSNVKALTRQRVKMFSTSENSNASMESFSDLAIKLGKLHRYEDVKGRYEAKGDITPSHMPQQLRTNSSGIQQIDFFPK